jgi:hypothetical protein
MTKPQDLPSLARALLESVERLRPLPPLACGAERADVREDILLALGAKVVPELAAGADLPVFIGVQGGTNTGKSTVFNALAGKLLSPAVVQASATKHPLVFVHERWRERLLAGGIFPDLACRELEDPKQLISEADRTELCYFQFHDDSRLAGVALVDSPDFDSVLATNLLVARRVAVLADITVFVTTAQKYRDRELVEHLRLLRELKAQVVILFNMVREQIVFETLLDDLDSVVPVREEDFIALRVPPSALAHPEEEILELLQARVLEPLLSCRPGEVKPLILRRALRRVLLQVDELSRLHRGELEIKRRLARFVDAELEKAVADYAAQFGLALPEETLAIRKLIRLTELWPRLELAGEVQSASRALRWITLGLRQFNETMRRLLVRFARSDEGAIDDTPAALAEYARARNEADFEQVLRGAERLRVAIESFCRGQQETSALARELAASFFGPEHARGYGAEVRRRFDAERAGRRSGEQVLEEVDRWLVKHPVQGRLVGLGGIGLKVASGGLLAAALPPAGILVPWNWLYFVAGYFLAAYAVALAVSLSIRRKRRFRRERIRSARTVFEASLVAPLAAATGELLNERDLRAMEKTAGALAVHPEVASAEVDPAARLAAPSAEAANRSAARR